MQLTYRALLIKELERRKKVNPAYSLRAFARDLGIAAPQLSCVLKGTKGISPLTAKKLTDKLELNAMEAEVFQHSAAALHSREKKSRSNSRQALQKLLATKSFQTVRESEFSVINEWFYLSLLQTFELRDFQPSSSWMAQRLGISKHEADKALKVLERAKLIEAADGFYRPSQEFVRTPVIPSRTIRTYLQQMLQKASQALETQPPEDRDFSSTVFPVNAARIDELKEKLRVFREDFCQGASDTRDKHEVYNLSIQFFRITERKP